MGNQIPERARIIVKQRAHWRCERCGVPNPSGEVHHRRSRLVRDLHQHCPCCLVFLCGTCHRWVHAHPFEAKRFGFIVSKFTAEPATVPTLRELFGETFYDCNGGTTT